MEWDASGGAEVVRAGGLAVWALPPDGRCAGVARKAVRETLGTLRLPEELVGDAVTMVSELATNAFVHGMGGQPLRTMPTAGLPEVQIYGCGTGTEIVVRVFDSAVWGGAAPARPEPDAEGGRGLEVVNALAIRHRGRWGVHRSRSVLGSSVVSGKVVYFALPVPVPWRPPRREACEAARELRGLLDERGIGPLHLGEGWGIAVLSVRAGITVWVRGGTFFVTLPSGKAACHPLCDLTDVVELIVRFSEDLIARVSLGK